MIFESVVVGPMQVNCYILAPAEGSKAVIIDPGSQERKIRQRLAAHSLEAGIVVNTHGHYDHIGCDGIWKVPVYIHPADAACLTDPQRNLSGFFSIPYRAEVESRDLQEGVPLVFNGIELSVLHIPGHTPGGVALVCRDPAVNAVFTGDSLFCLGIGRSDMPGGDEGLLVRSIREKLLVLPEEMKVYPGHGPASTIGEEKARNPYL